MLDFSYLSDSCNNRYCFNVDISTFTIDHAGYSSVPSVLSLCVTENTLCLSYKKKKSFYSFTSYCIENSFSVMKINNGQLLTMCVCKVSVIVFDFNQKRNLSRIFISIPPPTFTMIHTLYPVCSKRTEKRTQT